MWQLLVPLATGMISASNTNKKNEQMKAQNLAAAEQTRYSPWTKMGAGSINTNYGDPLASAIQGGIQGATFAQGFGGGSEQLTTPGGQLETYQGQNMLGGVDYSNQLGNQYANAFQPKPNYFASSR
jgi:hypothetical protein